jgi:alpha,alpha-trehalase
VKATLRAGLSVSRIANWLDVISWLPSARAVCRPRLWAAILTAVVTGGPASPHSPAETADTAAAATAFAAGTAAAGTTAAAATTVNTATTATTVDTTDARAAVAAHREPPQVLFQELFVAVQTAGIFPDSKTFADAVPKEPPERILAAYRR